MFGNCWPTSSFLALIPRLNSGLSDMLWRVSSDSIPPIALAMNFCSAHWPTSLIVLSLAIVLTGCDGRPKRVPVSGTVFIDGQPLKNGQIRMIPSTPNTRSAQSMIDSQGRFTLGTFEVNDGAVLGEHPVEIISVDLLPNGKKWLIPKKYASITTSGTTIKVEKPTTDMRIELTWDGGKPFVEAADNTGDAPPVGVVPEEPMPTEPTPPAEKP